VGRLTKKTFVNSFQVRGALNMGGGGDLGPLKLKYRERP